MSILRISTALTIALSVITAAGGALMFFGFRPAPIHVMHEWIAMAFVLAIALHIINHAKPMANHLKKPITIAIFSGVLAVSAAFFAFIPMGGVSAAKEVAKRAFRAPVSSIAPLFEMSEREFMDRLAAGGFDPKSANSTLAEIAAANKTTPDRLITAVVSE